MSTGLTPSGAHPGAPPAIEVLPSPHTRGTRRRRYLWLAVVVALVGLAGAGARLWSTTEELRRDQRAALAAQRQLRSELDRLGRRLDDQAATANGLSHRIGGLETKVNAVPDPAAVARAVEVSVFTIETADEQGSGFVLASSPGRSLLVTNFHVVASTSGGDPRVGVRQGERAFAGTVTKVDPEADLALVEVSVPLPVLERANAVPSVGEPVLALGSPLGLGGTVSSGIVSGLRRQGGKELIQFSAPVSPGSSGGPVVDRTGRVVGVTVMKALGEGAEGLSFAIPMARVCTALGVC